MPDLFAHSREGLPKEQWHSLEDHLSGTAKLAAEFASAFSSREWGYLAGLWHDLGKYRPEFQKRLAGE
ncbi:MAG: CRISPR-associated endonuclease Cas3'' [Elusimicrobia bacterium]|nr:CRISPR-associated endonuclease Cas3'' [Elusimicrobiota bacterium]